MDLQRYLQAEKSKGICFMSIIRYMGQVRQIAPPVPVASLKIKNKCRNRGVIYASLIGHIIWIKIKAYLGIKSIQQKVSIK